MTIYTNGASPLTQVRPGVQIVNVPPQILAAQPTPSSTIGLVGTASWGPIGIAIPVSNPNQCTQIFGPSINRKYDLGMPLYNAYLQGASNFVVVRSSDGTDLAATISVVVGSDTNTHPGVTLTAKYTGALGNNISITFSTGSKTNTLKATIALPGVATEVYNNLPSDLTVWAALVAAINTGLNANTPSQLVVATIGSGVTAPAAGLTATLQGGTDATSYAAVSSTTVIGSSATRTGIYALSKLAVNYLLAADADDSTTWTTLDAFASANGYYNIVAGPAGQTIASAIAAKGSAGIDSDWTTVCYGDWPTVYDQVNQLYRQCSPAAFKAGVLSSYTPNNSALNKQLSGIVTTQRSGNNLQGGLTTYSDAEIGQLLNAGIDIISNPSPGGTYFSFQGGINSSSNAAVNGDNWPQMTSVIGRTIASSSGGFVGQVFTTNLELRVRITIQNDLDNLIGQGLLNPGSYTVVCDSSNNPFSATSIGILTVNVNVTYQSIVKYFNVLLQGGQTVQEITVSS